MKKSDWLEGVEITGGIHTLQVKSGEQSKILNPHKEAKDENGMNHCHYGDAAAVEEIINGHKQNWDADWAFTRIDYCFDLQEPYARTEKLGRLFLLLMAQAMNLNNRYHSIDPMTGNAKTTSVRNSQYQIEHYDRSQKDQRYFDRQIINRLEFRMIGKAIRYPRDPFASVERWFEIINKSVTPENLQAVENATAQMCHAEWEKREGVRLPAFLHSHQRLICTRGQLLKTFALSGYRNPSEAVKNFMRTKIELVTLTDVKRLVEALRRAYDADQESRKGVQMNTTITIAESQEKSMISEDSDISMPF